MTVIPLKPSKPEQVSFSLPADQAALFADMVQGYREERCGARRYQKGSIDDELAAVNDFLRHAQKAPWFWDENDFAKWCFHLGRERMLAPSSQRKYQTAIKTFLAYLLDNRMFINLIHKAYKVRLRQICTSRNMIPHIVERELTKPRAAMPQEKVEQFLEAIHEHAETAANFKSKALNPLLRDYALYTVIYHFELRCSEARKLNLHDFDPNPDFPDAGAYGLARIQGKGSRGSGPKIRTVPTLDAQCAAVLDWYIKDVRPKLVSRKRPNEKALFLSERGTRISVSSIEGRFQNGLALAGMNGRGLSPHSLRHGATSDLQMDGMSLEGTRRRVGHEYGSTTQTYTHFPDEHTRNEIGRVINKKRGATPS